VEISSTNSVLTLLTEKWLNGKRRLRSKLSINQKEEEEGKKRGARAGV